MIRQDSSNRYGPSVNISSEANRAIEAKFHTSVERIDWGGITKMFAMPIYSYCKNIGKLHLQMPTTDVIETRYMYTGN